MTRQELRAEGPTGRERTLAEDIKRWLKKVTPHATLRGRAIDVGHSEGRTEYAKWLASEMLAFMDWSHRSVGEPASLLDFNEAISLLTTWVEEAEGILGPDLSTCPYYREEGSCSFGCNDEPECVTCVPEGGWPLERARALLARYGITIERGVQDG